MRTALSAHGYPDRTDAELDGAIGPPTVMALAQLTGEPEDSTAVRALTDSYHAAYARVYLTETTVIEPLVEVLGKLTLPLALATSKPTEFTLALLARLGLAQRFAIVCAPSARDLEEGKPVTVARAIARLSAQAPVMIGDRHFDVEAARANAIRSIGVTWGIGSETELRSAGADAIVARPRDLLALLEPSRFPERVS